MKGSATSPRLSHTEEQMVLGRSDFLVGKFADLLNALTKQPTSKLSPDTASNNTMATLRRDIGIAMALRAVGRVQYVCGTPIL